MFLVRVEYVGMGPEAEGLVEHLFNEKLDEYRRNAS